MGDLQQLVDAADAAALLRAVDGLCATRDWDALVDLGRRCTDAVELGRQLWPVAMHIDYRLALEGPAAHAAAVLRPGAGRFALGPLTEVAASTPDWASLAPHLRDPVTAATVAAERVLRGEDLTAGVAGSVLGVTELPLRRCAWEPSYALPTYRDRSAAFPSPPVATAGPPLPATTAGRRLDADEVVCARTDLVEVWVAQSAGRAAAVVVAGDAAAAVGRLDSEAVVEPLPAADALALLQWAGASGGAYGRRRGGAAGRFATWWSAAALACGLPWPDGPVDAGFCDELGDAVTDLRWHRWRGTAPDTGWVLRLAVEDPVDGLAWAVDAADERDEDLPVR